MEISQQTITQVDRALERTIAKFPQSDEATLFTDIHLKVYQESGELLSFDDDGEELNRAVIDDWIGDTSERFFEEATALLRQRLHTMSAKIDVMGIIKPFSFILEDDEAEVTAELYVADDDTIIIGDDLMAGLSDDLDTFFDNLIKN